MEISRPYVFLKDNFEVTLIKTDTEFRIEAKDQSHEKVFQEEFSIGAIKQMTNDLFDNIPEFFEALLAAFDEGSDETSIQVTKEGKLVFKKKLVFGKHEKMFNLTIPLKGMEEELSGSIGEQMQKLFREMKQLKKENEELKKETKELKEKLGCDYEMISPSFDKWCFHSNCFQVYGANYGSKSVTRNHRNENQIYPINSGDKLSRTWNTKFRVLIESFSSFIAIGVTVEKLLRSREWFNEDESYAVVMPDEIRRNGNTAKFATYSRLAEGSAVGVLFIPSRNEIEFDVDGKHIYTVKLKSEQWELDFYPIVSLQSNGDRVTFLDIHQ